MPLRAGGQARRGTAPCRGRARRSPTSRPRRRRPSRRSTRRSPRLARRSSRRCSHQRAKTETPTSDLTPFVAFLISVYTLRLAIHLRPQLYPPKLRGRRQMRTDGVIRGCGGSEKEGCRKPGEEPRRVSARWKSQSVHATCSTECQIQLGHQVGSHLLFSLML
jgi:hypothetical protein